MAKFFGKIGYAEMVEISPGVWDEKITNGNILVICFAILEDYNLRIRSMITSTYQTKSAL